MLFYYLTYLWLIIVKSHHAATNEHDNIISISSVLGTPLLFNPEILNQFMEDERIIWSKGNNDLKPLVDDFSVSSRSRIHIVNRTKLFITHTLIGDEGFYTLKIQTKRNLPKKYLFHVILFSSNLSFLLSPSSSSSLYQAEQSINFTCSISFFANHIYIEQIRSLFFSTWSMIIYNNDPDQYQLLPSSLTSYTYIASLLNYELNRHDHNQTVSCALIEQQSQPTMIQNTTLNNQFNVRYKAFLRGNYYFTRSFNAYSSIEINCEEFHANPQPIYTLLWMLNERNQTLLNKTQHGRYFIHNATWRNRGIYTCLAENDLNNHQPVHQSFRLNIWFTEHQSKSLVFSNLTFSKNNNQSFILIIVSLIFLFACLFCMFSFYCFCVYKGNR